MANVKVWAVKKLSTNDNHLKISKNRMITKIKTQTGVLLEQLNKGGMTGTTTTGNAGRRFFSAEMTPVLEELAPDESRAVIIDIHTKMSVILRIISSNKVVDVTAFETIVKELTLSLTKNFSWARLNFTLHASIQHSAELMRKNGNRGLGSLSRRHWKRTTKILGDLWRKNTEK